MVKWGVRGPRASKRLLFRRPNVGLVDFHSRRVWRSARLFQATALKLRLRGTGSKTSALCLLLFTFRGALPHSAETAVIDHGRGGYPGKQNFGVSGVACAIRSCVLRRAARTPASCPPATERDLPNSFRFSLQGDNFDLLHGWVDFV